MTTNYSPKILNRNNKQLITTMINVIDFDTTNVIPNNSSAYIKNTRNPSKRLFSSF